MGIGSFLFGSKPKLKTKTLPTLDPSQRALFDETLLPFLSQGPEAAGAAAPSLSTLETTSLAGLEQLATNFTEQGGSDVDKAASDALIKILTSGPEDVGGLFDTAVADPAIRQFQEQILPVIERAFAKGGNFFTSDRQGAISGELGNLMQLLTSGRAGAVLGEFESGRQAKLGAAGLAPGATASPIQSLLALLEGGQVPRQVELDKLAREDTRVAQILEALGLRTQENIAVGLGGSEGLVSGALKAFLSAGGATSSGAGKASTPKA